MTDHKILDAIRRKESGTYRAETVDKIERIDAVLVCMWNIRQSGRHLYGNVYWWVVGWVYRFMNRRILSNRKAISEIVGWTCCNRQHNLSLLHDLYICISWHNNISDITSLREIVEVYDGGNYWRIEWSSPVFEMLVWSDVRLSPISQQTQSKLPSQRPVEIGFHLAERVMLREIQGSRYHSNIRWQSWNGPLLCIVVSNTNNQAVILSFGTIFDVWMILILSRQTRILFSFSQPTFFFCEFFYFGVDGFLPSVSLRLLWRKGTSGF